MMMMMGQGSDRRELERAQLRLELARRRAGVDRNAPKPIGAGVKEMMRAIERAKGAQQLLELEHPEWYAEQAERDRERQLELQRLRLVDQGWPDRIVRQVVAGVDQDGHELVDQPHEVWLRQGLDQGSGLLVLHGWYGTGKTVGACRVLATWGANRAVTFMSAHRIRSLSRSSEDRETLDSWEIYAGIMVIDEVADDEETADHSKRIAGWLQRRWERGLQTVVLTNRRWTEIEGRPGKGDGIWPQALLSRIYQSGGVKRCKTILRPGENRRQGKAE
jgi:hypothetical protein